MGLGGDVAEDGLAAPVLGLQAEVRQLAADLLGLRVLLVDLVDRDHHRDVGGLRVVDRLLGLGHHPVVGGDDDDRHVGDLRAARAHGRERLVSGGVEEGDRAPLLMDLVGADVLGDPAGLARGHLGLADRVEQGGLAVVDVAHDRDHRRPDHQIALGVVEGGLVVDLLAGVHDLDLLVELAREHGDRLVREGLGQGRHLALLHQLLDDLGARDAEALGDLANGRPGVDLGGLRRLGARALQLGRLVEGRASPATAPARRALRRALRHVVAARGLRVDHDPPALLAGALPPPRRRRGAWPRRPSERPPDRRPSASSSAGRRRPPAPSAQRPARRSRRRS